MPDDVSPEERAELNRWFADHMKAIDEALIRAIQRGIRAGDVLNRIRKGYAVLRVEGLNREQAITRICQATHRSRQEVGRIVSEPYDP